MSSRPALYASCFFLICACGDDSAVVDAAMMQDGATTDTIARDGGDPDGAVLDAPMTDTRGSDAPDASSRPRGTVTFSAIYESPSAWDTNSDARATVERVFADLASHMRTSGDWDATVEVYFTDDSEGNARTSFQESLTRDVDGQTLSVVPAWANIVLHEDLGEAAPDGTDADFTIHYNVADHDDNDGLVRHEIMHGLGAVNRVPNFTLTDAGELAGPSAGDRVNASLYDLQLVDMNGESLLGDYDATDGTFAVQPFSIEATLVEWMDGSAGMFFRGRTADDVFDMACGTFPVGPNQGALVLNEPADVMSAAVHPTWNSVEEPDLAFLRAMGYAVEP